MKKILTLILALCMLCGVAAADTTITNSTENGQGTTIVQYTVAASNAYTVTIPATVTLIGTAGSNVATGTLSVKIDATNYNNYEKGIQVSIVSFGENGRQLVYDFHDTKYQIPYTIKMGETELVDEALNVPFLEWFYQLGNTELDYTAEVEFALSATIPSNLPAGDYAGTLTFGVSLAESSD